MWEDKSLWHSPEVGIRGDSDIYINFIGEVVAVLFLKSCKVDESDVMESSSFFRRIAVTYVGNRGQPHLDWIDDNIYSVCWRYEDVCLDLSNCVVYTNKKPLCAQSCIRQMIGWINIIL